MTLGIHIDGGSRGNPGPAACGVVLTDLDQGQVVVRAGYFLGRMTNNAAEYAGLLRALKLAAQRGATDLRIASDSQLMVRQILGEYRVKSPDLKPLFEAAQEALLQFNTWRIEHVYRDHNVEADRMANLAMDRKRDVIETDIPSNLASVSACQPQGPTSAAPGADEADVRFDEDPSVIGWRVTLMQAPSSEACPAPAPDGACYLFGSTTPGGMCVHAAQAVFDEAPLEWPERRLDRYDVRCARCQARLRIELDPQL